MGNEISNKNGENKQCSLADELKQESERLRQLAEKLKAREEALAEMEENYPHYREFVFAKLREEAERTLEELPADGDLEAYAKKLGAQPLDDILEELDRLEKGS